MRLIKITICALIFCTTSVMWANLNAWKSAWDGDFFTTDWELSLRDNNTTEERIINQMIMCYLFYRIESYEVSIELFRSVDSIIEHNPAAPVWQFAYYADFSFTHKHVISRDCICVEDYLINQMIMAYVFYRMGDKQEVLNIFNGMNRIIESNVLNNICAL